MIVVLRYRNQNFGSIENRCITLFFISGSHNNTLHCKTLRETAFQFLFYLMYP